MRWQLWNVSALSRNHPADGRNKTSADDSQGLLTGCYRAEMPPDMEFNDAIDRLGELSVPTLIEETVTLHESIDRILAKPLFADRDLPPFDRACMDGYAYASGRQEAMPVVGEVQAGDGQVLRVPSGSCVSISTGAPLPPDTDTVIPHELTDRGSPLHVLGEWPHAGANVHLRGADACAGDCLIDAGTRIGTSEIGLLAMAGTSTVSVRGRPHVAILTTGNEVVSQEDTPKPHQIRNSNGPMLASLVDRLGGHIISMTHLPDELGNTTQKLRMAMEQVPIIVTTGGISAGDHDHMTGALDDLGIAWKVQGVAMQPGKPIRIGQCGTTTIVCLPGNPVSALVTGTLFLSTIMRLHLGIPSLPQWRPVTLAAHTRCNPRRALFRPAALTSTTSAVVPTWQGSGDLAHAAGTDGLVRLPLASECASGTEVPFMPWP